MNATAVKLALDSVDSYVQQHRHTDRSFVRYVSQGLATREQLKRWAIQKFHQVYEQNRVFSAIHSNSDSERVRQFMVRQLIAEETDICDGSDSHYALMERFAIAAGATSREVRSAVPGVGVLRFVEFLLSLARSRRPIDCLLTFYINESQSSEASQKLYSVLKRQFDLSDDDLEWFEVHGRDDVAHASEARSLLVEIADERFVEDSLEVARRACDEWLLLHQFYADLVQIPVTQEGLPT